jgi:hypothetical protein
MREIARFAQALHEIARFKADNRLLLSGTPLQV